MRKSLKAIIALAAATVLAVSLCAFAACGGDDDVVDPENQTNTGDTGDTGDNTDNNDTTSGGTTASIEYQFTNVCAGTGASTSAMHNTWSVLNLYDDNTVTCYEYRLPTEKSAGPNSVVLDGSWSVSGSTVTVTYESATFPYNETTQNFTDGISFTGTISGDSITFAAGTCIAPVVCSLANFTGCEEESATTQVTDGFITDTASWASAQIEALGYSSSTLAYECATTTTTPVVMNGYLDLYAGTDAPSVYNAVITMHHVSSNLYFTIRTHWALSQETATASITALADDEDADDEEAEEETTPYNSEGYTVSVTGLTTTFVADEDNGDHYTVNLTYSFDGATFGASRTMELVLNFDIYLDELVDAGIMTSAQAGLTD